MLRASCIRNRLLRFSLAATQVRCKTLLIVESATKAKTIQQYLEDDYIVDCSGGHIRDLINSGTYSGELISPHLMLRTGSLGVDVKNNFSPDYKVLPEKKEVVARLRSHLANCDTLILATDDDREGEAIAWHLVEVLQPKIPVERVVLHEITKEAVQRAISSPRKINMGLVEAQEARRILDRLTGFTLSPLLWTIFGGSGGTGRVQSATLHMICERERKRWEFQPSQYYMVDATFITAAGVPLVAKLSEIDRCKVTTEEELHKKKKNKDQYIVVDVSMAHRLMNHCKTVQNSFCVTSITQKQLQRAPPLPFTTSTLQQQCATVLNLSPLATMAIAQSLYEKGYITYMRTDNTELGEEGRNVAISTVEERFGSKYVSGQKMRSKNAQFAQLAHEAIRPATHNNRFLDPSQIKGTDAEKAMYELIYKQTLASVMSKSIMNSRTITITSTESSEELQSVSFQASGSEVVFDGFRAILKQEDASSDENFLSHIKVGSVVRLRPSATNNTRDNNLDLRCELRTTTPPHRYTDGGMTKLLEDAGIGRPSTYSTIVPKLIARDYLISDNRTIVPTVLGMVVANLLHKLCPRLVDASFTADMESKLDAIADGKLDKVTLLRDYYFGTTQSEVHITGLLPTVESVVQNKETMSNKDIFRELIIPSIADLGKIMYYKKCTVLSTHSGRWPLTPDMQQDLRNITRDSITELMKGGRLGSRTIGMKRVNGIEEDVKLCNGPFGAYLEVGDKKRKGRVYNIPSWLSSSAPVEHFLEFTSLPLQIGKHPQTSRNIIIQVKGRQLCVGLDGYEKHCSLPDNVLPSQVTLSQCLELLGDGSSLKEPELGEWEGTKILLKSGRFGHYLSCGELSCSVKSDVVPNLTAELAQKMIADKLKGLEPTKKKKVAKSIAQSDAVKSKAKTSSKKATKSSNKNTAKTSRKKAAKTALANKDSNGSASANTLQS